MLWHPLTEISQLHDIVKFSKEQSSEKLTVLLFKHSTRCSISSMALNRLENKWVDDASIKTYYLDLLSYRPVSAKIESLLHVEHQSPQAILLQNGKSIWDASHYDIQFESIRKKLGK